MNRLQIFLALLVFMIVFPGFSQEVFPAIAGKTLSGEELTLPQKRNGKVTLLGLAYSKKAEDDLQTWFQPVYSTFIQKSENSFFPTDDYQVNIYFVPMLSGISKAASGKVEDKLKKNVDQELQPHVLLYSGEIKTYKDQLNMQEKDKPYFFVIDQDGKILYSCSGAYSEENFEKITDIIDEEEEE